MPDLNPAQQLAVSTIEGPVMVLAGPGTGKTQTLAMRIANILQQTQMDPWNILCLTFTESGVAAMRSRLLSIIGTPAYYVRIHTFHSFCNEILQDHPEIFAKGDTWRLVSDAEKVEIFQAIVDMLPEGSPLKPFYAPYLYFSDVTKTIGELKQEDISPEAFVGVLDALEVFFQDIQDNAGAFFGLTPKLRTHEACEQLRVAFQDGFARANVQKSVAYAVDQIFVQYEEQYAASDSVRDQSKARTQLKNAVKKWFEGESKNLNRNRALAEVYKKYEEKLAESGMYDYEDMISRCVAELKKNPDLLADYQEQFQYILVDEYQDTNGGQNEIVELLGSFDDAPNMFVVGDDKQSIYRFQGASLANMLSFYERYKRAITVISLTENYRSQKKVIDASGALISHNAESLKAHIPGIIEQLLPGRQIPEKNIDGITTESQDQEEFVIGQKIRTLIENGAKPEDIAVLYRYNADGNSLLHTLRTMNIPARIEMGENIFDVPAVRQWAVLLEWLVSGRDELLARIIQYTWWNLDVVDTLKIIHYSGRQYISLYSAISSKAHLANAEVGNPEAFLAFSTQLAEFSQECTNMSVMAFLEHVIKETKWMGLVMGKKDAVIELRAMKRFLNEAKELASVHVGYSVQDFVQHLSFLQHHDIDLLTPQWEGGVGAVHLMSAHKAKGLEWLHVFVMKMNDKHWGNPKKRAGVSLPEGLVKYDFVFKNDRNEDERRLFYVALTRAMQTVTLTRSSHSATGKETVPSIFLSEIPKEYISEIKYEETPEMQENRLLETLIAEERGPVSEDAKAYIKSQLGNYVMSVTHLNNYLECTQKFYWRNILQIPSMKTRSLMLGSALHDTLRDVFEMLHQGKPVPDSSMLQQLFEKYLRHEPMSETDFNEILSRGNRAIMGYVDHYKDNLFSNVLTEHNFKKYHVMIGDVPVTGKLDKIEILDEQNKLINVVDYKTGDSDKWYQKVKKDGNYARQMIFYKLLCDNAKQFGYTMKSGEIDFVEPSKKGYVKKKIEITEEDTKNLTETIQRVWQEIQNLSFMDPATGCHKKDCEYCN
ncbi:MAG: UvrD-helicase domain-containing protein [Candidatus Andersenbacteria bacterium]|nr:UvrD-helicase domain-containing protein [Candidatus Andersenbacteria bacterium]